MTREELKNHCLRTVQRCEEQAEWNREAPHSKVYQEHKLVLELLEQEDTLGKIKAEIDELPRTYPYVNHFDSYVKLEDLNKIFDKYLKGE